MCLFHLPIKQSNELVKGNTPSFQKSFLYNGFKSSLDATSSSLSLICSYVAIAGTRQLMFLCATISYPVMSSDIKMEIDSAVVWVQKHLKKVLITLFSEQLGTTLQDCIRAITLISPRWLNVIDLRITFLKLWLMSLNRPVCRVYIITFVQYAFMSALSSAFSNLIMIWMWWDLSLTEDTEGDKNNSIKNKQQCFRLSGSTVMSHETIYDNLVWMIYQNNPVFILFASKFLCPSFWLFICWSFCEKFTFNSREAWNLMTHCKHQSRESDDKKTNHPTSDLSLIAPTNHSKDLSSLLFSLYNKTI